MLKDFYTILHSANLFYCSQYYITINKLKINNEQIQTKLDIQNIENSFYTEEKNLNNTAGNINFF